MSFFWLKYGFQPLPVCQIDKIFKLYNTNSMFPIKMRGQPVSQHQRFSRYKDYVVLCRFFRLKYGFQPLPVCQIDKNFKLYNTNAMFPIKMMGKSAFLDQQFLRYRNGILQEINTWKKYMEKPPSFVLSFLAFQMVCQNCDWAHQIAKWFQFKVHPSISHKSVGYHLF